MNRIFKVGKIRASEGWSIGGRWSFDFPIAGLSNSECWLSNGEKCFIWSRRCFNELTFAGEFALFVKDLPRSQRVSEI